MGVNSKAMVGKGKPDWGQKKNFDGFNLADTAATCQLLLSLSSQS